MKKPPGHDAKRLLLRLPVSQFRRCPQQHACGPNVPPAKEKARQREPARIKKSRRWRWVSDGFSQYETTLCVTMRSRPKNHQNRA
jgi:hypothetical protein